MSKNQCDYSLTFLQHMLLLPGGLWKLSKRWVRRLNNTYCIDFNCFALHGSFHLFELRNDLLCRPRHLYSAWFSRTAFFFGPGCCLCVYLCNCQSLLQLPSSWAQQLSSADWSEVNSCQVSGRFFSFFYLFLHACRQMAECMVGGENQLSSAKDKVNVVIRAS